MEKTGPYQQEFCRIVGDMRRIEQELSAQLELLGKNVDAQFGLCAGVLGRAVAMVGKYGRITGKALSNLNIAGAVAVRGLGVAGKLVSAQRRNSRLDKLMETKKQIAAAKLEPLCMLRQPVESNVEALQRLVMAYAAVGYPLDGSVPVHAHARVLWQCIDALRLSLELRQVRAYLEAEYRAWAGGAQSSGRPFPSRIDANRELAALLFGQHPLDEAFALAAASSVSVTGAQLMLLADEQLSLLALASPQPLRWRQLDFDAGIDTHIRSVLLANGGVMQYRADVDAFVRHANSNPSLPWDICCAVAMLAVAAMCIWTGNGTPAARVAVGILSAGFMASMWWRTRQALVYRYVQDMKNSAAEMYVRWLAAAGYLPGQRPDLEKKDLLKTGMDALLHPYD